jgi:RecA-family ATPase
MEAKEKHVIHLAEVRPEPIDWFWPGHIAAGKLTLIDGDPGLGKSLITLDLAARLTTGRDFPDGSACTARAGVVLVGNEDGVSDTIIGRLQAAGADLRHVHSFDGTSRPGASKGPPTFPDDCPVLEEVIHESKARLVIIDPLLAFISSKCGA